MTDSMPIWAVVVAAFFGAVGGLSGVAAILKVVLESRATARATEALAKKTDLEALRIVVEELQDENKRRGELIDALQTKANDLQCKVDKLTVTVRKYRDGIRLLLAQLQELGIEPVWRPDIDDIEV